MEADQAKAKMARTITVFKDDLARVRTGRAHPGIFDHIQAECYDQRMAIPQLATVSAAGPRTLVVAPWDSNNIEGIAVAISESGLALTPSVEADLIRITVPELSEERRMEMVKIVNRMAEAGRVSVRNIRRDLMQSFKEQEKEGILSQDEQKHAGSDLQKITDENVSEITRLAEEKAAELMAG